MTTIVGIQGDGWSVMAADSQITEENSKIISSETPKIVRFKDIMIGLRGDARPGDIIAYGGWKPPKITTQIDPKTYVVSKLIPSMIAALDKAEYDYKNKESDFNFLVSVKGELFDVGSDFSISRSDEGFYATGSGAGIANGYIYAKLSDNADIVEAQRVAENAIQAAIKFDINTGGPIQVELYEEE